MRFRVQTRQEDTMAHDLERNVEQRVNDLMLQLTLKEKVSLLAGLLT